MDIYVERPILVAEISYGIAVEPFKDTNDLDNTICDLINSYMFSCSDDMYASYELTINKRLDRVPDKSRTDIYNKYSFLVSRVYTLKFYLDGSNNNIELNKIKIKNISKYLYKSLSEDTNLKYLHNEQYFSMSKPRIIFYAVSRHDKI